MSEWRKRLRTFIETRAAEFGREMGMPFGLVLERLLAPMARFAAWAYLFIAIMFLGGFGIWTAVAFTQFVRGDPAQFQDALNSLLFSVATYGGALFGTARADGYLDRRNDRAAQFVLFAINVAIAIVAGLACWKWYVEARVATDAFGGGWIALPLVLMWLMWWIASASDPRFFLYTQPPPDAAAGGNPMRKDIES